MYKGQHTMRVVCWVYTQTFLAFLFTLRILLLKEFEAVGLT